MMTESRGSTREGGETGSAGLRIIDERTGQEYSLPVTEGAVRATELRAIKTSSSDLGLMSFDPGLVNTGVCHSSITFIDGNAGILEYRGYPIEQLTEHADYPKVAYLLLYGELPTETQYREWQRQLSDGMMPPEPLLDLIGAFPQDAHPMSILQAAVAGLGSFYPESKRVHDGELRCQEAPRLVAQISALGAMTYRHLLGEPIVRPRPERDYLDNLLTMLFADAADPDSYEPSQERRNALDVLLILHADHEQNASTSTVRSVGSTDADPYASISAGVGALYGPRHGGANEAVLKMLRQIGSPEHVPEFVDSVKQGGTRLMGFGHRVYKNYDPRARIIKARADALISTAGSNPLLEVAQKLEEAALHDDYFKQRKLYPNVDFYSGLIYEAFGLPAEMFTVIFAIARSSGWFAHWHELMGDEEQKIVRPRQIYTGPRQREVPPDALLPS